MDDKNTLAHTGDKRNMAVTKIKPIKSTLKKPSVFYAVL